jgi:hypothetical protein
MSKVRKLTIFVLAFSFFLEADPVSYVLHGSWTSTAEALIGRPATLAWRGARRGAVRLARIASTVLADYVGAVAERIYGVIPMRDSP